MEEESQRLQESQSRPPSAQELIDLTLSDIDVEEGGDAMKGLRLSDDSTPQRGTLLTRIEGGSGERSPGTSSLRKRHSNENTPEIEPKRRSKRKLRYEPRPESNCDSTDSCSSEERLAMTRNMLKGDMSDILDMPLEKIPKEVLAESGWKCLKRRAWLTNFMIDDMMEALIEKYNLQQDILYVPMFYFKMLQNMIPNLLIEVARFLYAQNAYKKDPLLVLTCTGEGDVADHWILGVISFKHQAIILMDSVDEMDDSRVEIFRCLASLAHMTYGVENICGDKVSSFKFIYSTDCARQSNNFDCGVHVCLNAHAIMQEKECEEVDGATGRQWIYHVLSNHKSKVRSFCVNSPQTRSQPLSEGTLERASKGVHRFQRSLRINVKERSTKWITRKALRDFF